MENKVAVITNPYAGKNVSQSGRLQKLRELVHEFGEVRETRNLEQLRSAIEDLQHRKVGFLVCDGGDGTVHWVLNSLLESMNHEIKGELPVFVPTNGGTIDFLAEKAGIHGKTEGILRLLVRKLRKGDPLEIRHINSFLFHGKTADMGSFTKIGFSAAIAGAGQRFFEKYYQDNKPSSRTIIEVISKTTLSHLLQMSPFSKMVPDEIRDYSRRLFEPKKARVVIDGKEIPESEFTAINAGSIGINLKNVIKLFHKADKNGKLHAVVANLSPLELISNIPNLMSGKDFSGKGMYEMEASVIEAYAMETPFHPVIDGEIFDNVTECRLTVGPRVPMISLDARRPD